MLLAKELDAGKNPAEQFSKMKFIEGKMRSDHNKSWKENTEMATAGVPYTAGTCESCQRIL